MGIRIDALDPAVSAQADHQIPAMRSNVTVRLSVEQIAAFTAALLVDSAPATLDTLNELAAALGDDPNFAATTATALANRLRFDAAQSLNAVQQLQGQTNLGVVGLIPDYVQGLTLSNNATDANNDIDISIGSAKGSGKSVTNGATMTKRLDAAWAAGTGNGGLDTGSKANSTTYRVWPLRNTSTGAADFIFSMSTTAGGVNVPSGYEVVAPSGLDIGMIYTDGSGNIRAFKQTGNKFSLGSWPNDMSSESVGTTAISKTLTVPIGRNIEVLLTASVNQASASGFLFSSLDFDPDIAPTVNGPSQGHGGAGIRTNDEIRVIASSSGQVRVRAAISATQFTTYVRGWTDYLIPRIG